MSSTLVHVVYIHGFQGNDTTFQSFPTDLQRHLSARIPSHLQIQSSVYPTYKSVKPISFATRNFLEWLTTQPPGPVILLGHSMGGLLAADAATTSSMTTRRIIGMVAFDTPYLGMHPHVVVSGIASLFPKGKDNGKKAEGKVETARDLNDETQVKMIDDEVTDDWEGFKKGLDGSFNRASRGSRSLFPSPSPSPGPSPAHTPFVDRTFSFLSDHSNDPLVRWFRKHPDLASSKRWVIEHFQFGICMFDPKGLRDRYRRLVAWDGHWVNYWTETMSRHGEKGEPGLEQEEDGDEPDDGIYTEELMAMVDNNVAPDEPDLAKLSLFLPSSATDPPAADAPTADTLEAPDPPMLGAPTKSEAKAAEKATARTIKEQEKTARDAEKARARALKRQSKGKVKVDHCRHFVVVPTGLGRVLGGGERWEKVLIAGVQDEVEAHTGLFIRGKNLDYEALVDRVGERVLEWCEAVK